jgi:hypothetical protein
MCYNESLLYSVFGVEACSNGKKIILLKEWLADKYAELKDALTLQRKDLKICLQGSIVIV